MTVQVYNFKLIFTSNLQTSNLLKPVCPKAHFSYIFSFFQPIPACMKMCQVEGIVVRTEGLTTFAKTQPPTVGFHMLSRCYRIFNNGPFDLENDLLIYH